MASKGNETEQSEKGFLKKTENWIILFGVLAVVVALCTPFVILYKLGWNITYVQFDKLGVVGDFFGGTTVGLFTLASIIFVISAIVMQKKELELQRRELALTRQEFKTGNTTAKVQQVDNAFFNMLSLHHQIVNNITFYNKSKTYAGRQAVENLKCELEDRLGFKLFLKKNPGAGLSNWLRGGIETRDFIEEIFSSYDTIDQDDLDEIYKDFHDDFGNAIGHYMRNNYRIVKFIINNVAEDKNEQARIKNETGREPIISDKRYYFGMLRAQWSNAEFEMIFINSLYRENHKFKDLILKYDVLDIKEKTTASVEDQEFKLKSNMTRFYPYRKLIEFMP
jgi:uncharacterized membrane protein